MSFQAHAQPAGRPLSPKAGAATFFPVRSETTPTAVVLIPRERAPHGRFPCDTRHNCPKSSQGDPRAVWPWCSGCATSAAPMQRHANPYGVPVAPAGIAQASRRYPALWAPPLPPATSTNPAPPVPPATTSPLRCGRPAKARITAAEAPFRSGRPHDATNRGQCAEPGCPARDGTSPDTTSPSTAAPGDVARLGWSRSSPTRWPQSRS